MLLTTYCFLRLITKTRTSWSQKVSSLVKIDKETKIWSLVLDQLLHPGNNKPRIGTLLNPIEPKEPYFFNNGDGHEGMCLAQHNHLKSVQRDFCIINFNTLKTNQELLYSIVCHFSLVSIKILQLLNKTINADPQTVNHYQWLFHFIAFFTHLDLSI